MARNNRQRARQAAHHHAHIHRAEERKEPDFNPEPPTLDPPSYDEALAQIQSEAEQEAERAQVLTRQRAQIAQLRQQLRQTQGQHTAEVARANHEQAERIRLTTALERAERQHRRWSPLRMLTVGAIGGAISAVAGRELLAGRELAIEPAAQVKLDPVIESTQTLPLEVQQAFTGTVPTIESVVPELTIPEQASVRAIPQKTSLPMRDIPWSLMTQQQRQFPNYSDVDAQNRQAKKHSKKALFIKAAKQGHAQAQYEVANAYLMADGASYDETRAVTWLKLAASQGHEEAQLKLAMCTLIGLGVAQDVEQAQTLLNQLSPKSIRKIVEAYRNHLDYPKTYPQMFTAAFIDSFYNLNTHLDRMSNFAGIVLGPLGYFKLGQDYAELTFDQGFSATDAYHLKQITGSYLTQAAKAIPKALMVRLNFGHDFEDVTFLAFLCLSQEPLLLDILEQNPRLVKSNAFKQVLLQVSEKTYHSDGMEYVVHSTLFFDMAINSSRHALLGRLCKNNKRLLTDPDFLATLIRPVVLYDDQPAYLTPLYVLAKSEQGQKLLLNIVKKNPHLAQDPAFIHAMTVIPIHEVMDGDADKSSMYYLIASRTGQKMLSFLMERNPKLAGNPESGLELLGLVKAIKEEFEKMEADKELAAQKPRKQFK